MRERARHLALLIGLVGCVCALGACNRGREKSDGADRVELDEQSIASRVRSSELSDPQTRQGLGVRLLVVDDTGYDAPRALRAFEDPPSPTIDERTRERWAGWGFRLIEVPMDRLDETLGSMRAVRPISNQWVGEFGAWRPLIRSGQNSSTRVRVGESFRTIEPGRPSIIARSWIEPELAKNSVERALRLDLGVRIETPKDRSFTLLPDQRVSTLDDDGQVIDALLSTLTLRGDRAIVIVGEVPDADWSELPAPASTNEDGSVDGAGEVGPSANDETRGEDAVAPSAPAAPFSSRSVTEPRAPTLRSLGELMFVAPGSRMSRAGQARKIPKRVVVVLIPRVRGEYELLAQPLPIGGVQ